MTIVPFFLITEKMNAGSGLLRFAIHSIGQDAPLLAAGMNGRSRRLRRAIALIECTNKPVPEGATSRNAPLLAAGIGILRVCHLLAGGPSATAGTCLRPPGLPHGDPDRQRQSPVIGPALSRDWLLFPFDP